MKKLSIGLLFVILITTISCDEQQGFGFGGPTYDHEGNLAIDREKIAQYLQTAEIDSLYRIHDPSGVVIIVQEEGDGVRPTLGSVIYTNYIGSLLDGTVFDTNIEQVAIEHDLYDEERSYNLFSFFLGEPASQGGAIDGFRYGFQRLRSGSKAVLLIPSPYGYRNNTNIPLIPENSVLVFDVDFLGLD